MQPWRMISAITLLAVIIIFAFPCPALAQSGSPPNAHGLSPYWNPDVSRWESSILPYANERNLDPDLIAAVIWKESLGRAWERGPVGAVGLMGVMPFDWRPSAEELENPWTNVAWGGRALAHTIRDGQGDLYYALAAYNGGWEQIHLGVTRRYAADVLNHYTRAVAMRYELPSDGNWIAIIAAEGAPSPNTITVIGPQRPLARYTERPWVQANIPTVPNGVPPHATAITFVDQRGTGYWVNVWLVAEDGSPLEIEIPSTEQSLSLPSPADHGQSGQYTPPTATPTQPPVSTSIPTPAPVITAPSTPTLTPTLTLTTTCQGGPLQLDAWHLERACAPGGGWTATIFVEGRGGDCLYTYMWEGEVKGGPTSGPMTFEIHQVDRFAAIMGTASVTSTGKTVNVGLFIKPPFDDDD